MLEYFLDVTQRAAWAASALIGTHDKNTIDAVATKSMTISLEKVPANLRIVLGEGEKDNAPGLRAGDLFGGDYNWDEHFDIVVDPVEGTTQTTKGGPDAVSVLAYGPKDGFMVSGSHYMMKMAFSKEITQNHLPGFVSNFCSLNPDEGYSCEQTAQLLNGWLGRPSKVCILDRPRHTRMIEEYRKGGANIYLVPDCDVVACIRTYMGEFDLYVGMGGTTEGILAAVAAQHMGGEFIGGFIPNGGTVPKEMFVAHELAHPDSTLVMTGITKGNLLSGPTQSFVAHGGSTYLLSKLA